MSRMDRILIADDHPLVRGALALSVEAAFGRIEILECASFGELIVQLERTGIADLALLDLLMPGVNGFDGLLTVRARFPETPVVIISALEERRLVDEAIALGAAGFIPKSTPRQDIVAALHRVAAGEIYIPADRHAADAAARRPLDAEDIEIAQKLSTLTTQQLRVLRLLGTGKLNKEIAYELEIAEPTVKVHVSAILQKLKVYSRTQAVVVAGRLLSTEVLEEAGQGRFSRERTSA
ncbi:MAG: DNA-binding response regulator [Rhodospirillales bacterium]|nr:DNA-binding response regulator [Rhodospirillales bacterium]